MQSITSSKKKRSESDLNLVCDSQSKNRSCGCNEAGSFNNTATCNTVSGKQAGRTLNLLLLQRGNDSLSESLFFSVGQCFCKHNVEGQRCDMCKPGYFDLQTENEFGCLPCFCYGHSSQCDSASGYSRNNIESLFTRDAEYWVAKSKSGIITDFQYNAINKNIGAKGECRGILLATL